MSLKFHDPQFSHLIGRRVKVKSTARYKNQHEGQNGTIRTTWNANSIGVDMDFQVNDRSKFGYFYFHISELIVLDKQNNKTAEAEEKGENTMSNLTNYLNVATVKFLDDPEAFRTIECANYETALQVGDICVVQTAHHGLGLAEVEAIAATPIRGNLTREIVARVDTFDFDTRVEQRKRAAELKAKMQERAKKLQDLVLFQTLAKDDPEMAALLQDFMALNQ